MLAGADMRMTKATDEMEVTFSITADSAPICYRYMMASPPQLRRRRMTRLIPMACETVLRTLTLGGRMYSGGKLNPSEFASEGLDDLRWKSTTFTLVLYPDITPFLCRALAGKPTDQASIIMTTCLESYLLTVGATSAPGEAIEPARSPFEQNELEAVDLFDLGQEGSSRERGSGLSLREGSTPQTQSSLDSANESPVVESGVEGDVASSSAVSTLASTSSTQTGVSDDTASKGLGDSAAASTDKLEVDEEQKRFLERMRSKGVAK